MWYEKARGSSDILIDQSDICIHALHLTILVNDQIDMIGIKIKYDCIGQFYRVKMTYY